ncbi:MAG: response regulator [Gemmatimonadota bacterium]
MGEDNSATGSRPCVIVVDDDAHDREIYGRILYYNGFDVVFAPSGAAALDLADRHPADLVLLDLGLPDIELHAIERLIGRAPLAGVGRPPQLHAAPV